MAWAELARRILGEEDPPIPDRYVTVVESEPIEIDWEAIATILMLQDWIGGRGTDD